MSAGDWKELYTAAAQGDLEMVRFHIRQGVDPNYQHPEILSTPLVAAILAGYTEVALYLLDHGADPKLQSILDQLDPFQAAIQVRNEKLIQKLK